ncbi:LysR family transcriptional regulator [Occultella aeris]|uniref:Hydrogen peroxide-inducible genes activator n=1 Tax=Occultella aeris TaxID=2761496 RepID=A0A7M4DNK9_9MICO|nr:LysR family transcriptional regulator [Occultella aeris]VZO39040.1 Hydrogen peroxide-inducible genes activator [Occultella aeris]
MQATLDITPLRSLVAVADHGGFARAAEALHLTQPAVSQHIRKLEKAVGRDLVTKRGRVSVFTEAGTQLLDEARLILSAHDGALGRLQALPTTIVVGSTEHGAEDLLPVVADALRTANPGATVRFRVDRGARLAEEVEHGTVDVALLLGTDDAAPGDLPAAPLPVSWFAAPGWRAPEHGAIPVVAFDAPCRIRDRALRGLAEDGRPGEVTVDCTSLSGVLVAVRSGLGVTALPLQDAVPGLVLRPDLPDLEPIPLRVRARVGAIDLGRVAAQAIRDHLRSESDTSVRTFAAAT